MPRLSEDRGSVQVLEAVMVALVMVGSVAFVVTYDVAMPGSHGGRAALGQKAADALAILQDTPVEGSALGTNLLDVGLLECLQGSCERLDGKLSGLLPEGTYYAVYLSNGEGVLTVLERQAPGGEAVTARRSLEPAWSYHFLAPAQSVFNPLQDPLVITGIPVYSYSPVEPSGSALAVTVRGNRSSDNAGVVLKAGASTRAAAESAPGAAASLFFHDGAGTPLAATDVRAQTLDAGLAPTRANVTFHVRLAETQGGTIPEGTLLSIQVPRGWLAGASQAVNAARWTILSNATDLNGTTEGATILARLDTALTGAVADLELNASYYGDEADHYAFSATLTSGAYARAALLVRADGHAALPARETPQLLVSAPRPMGATAQTTWTLAALSPDPVEVTRVEIAEEDARAIFGAVEGIASAGGSWSVAGDRIVWTGAALVSQDAPLALTFRVTPSGVATPGGDRPPFVPSVLVDGWSAPLSRQIAPGLHQGSLAPASGSYQGYDTSTGLGLRAEHPATSDSGYRSTALPGSVNYSVGYVTGLGDSVFGAAVGVEARHVPHGGTARIEVDVQSVMYRLAVLGHTPSIDVRVYPPWSGDARVPIHEETLYDGALALGGSTLLDALDVDDDGTPEASEAGRFALDVPVPSGWLYGPYIVEARVTWAEHLAEILDGAPFAEDIVRSAYVHDYFVVTPSAGAQPASPVYDVHLVAWHGDWG